jgi:hypothetical protein
MDLMTVCQFPSDPVPSEYLNLMAVLVGLVLNLAMWAHHRRLAARPVARRIFPIN